MAHDESFLPHQAFCYVNIDLTLIDGTENCCARACYVGSCVVVVVVVALWFDRQTTG